MRQTTRFLGLPSAHKHAPFQSHSSCQCTRGTASLDCAASDRCWSGSASSSGLSARWSASSSRRCFVDLAELQTAVHYAHATRWLHIALTTPGSPCCVKDCMSGFRVRVCALRSCRCGVCIACVRGCRVGSRDVVMLRRQKLNNTERFGAATGQPRCPLPFARPLGRLAGSLVAG